MPDSVHRRVDMAAVAALIVIVDLTTKRVANARSGYAYYDRGHGLMPAWLDRWASAPGLIGWSHDLVVPLTIAAMVAGLMRLLREFAVPPLLSWGLLVSAAGLASNTVERIFAWRWTAPAETVRGVSNWIPVGGSRCCLADLCLWTGGVMTVMGGLLLAARESRRAHLLGLPT